MFIISHDGHSFANTAHIAEIEYHRLQNSNICELHAHTFAGKTIELGVCRDAHTAHTLLRRIYEAWNNNEKSFDISTEKI